MSEAHTIGLDLAKHVFQAHGADASGRVVFRKRLRREGVLEFFAGKPPCVVAMEACSSAHYWGRALAKLDHTVRLIPPAYVKPFVKRQKNDAADAEAICEAAQRPTMRFVALKSEGCRRMLSCSEPVTCSSGNGRRQSTRCAGISESTAWWPRRA